MNEERTSSPTSAQASEVQYELHTLGWRAFQDLCGTILREIWGQTSQVFHPGRDGGRDGYFSGTWAPQMGEAFVGTFTVQAKFFSERDRILRSSDLSSELAKAKKLASRGLADNYILMTNAQIIATTEAEGKDLFESMPGLKRFAGFGREAISHFIRESSRLRMLVPRIYGLGDLSMILDERARQQTEEILFSTREDLSKFVTTDAYHKSVEVLHKHGFVLLLGEPSCGKSTIATALTIGASDMWGCSRFRVRSPKEFKEHWNPMDPKRLFWIDDAFGVTQFDPEIAHEWSRYWADLSAAIRQGARVIFTSRDYIYKQAQSHLKLGSFPLMEDSQVAIYVERLSKAEKAQILYNHIKRGRQEAEFKRRIKSLLPEIPSNRKFLPETARRLGDPHFTKNLGFTKGELKRFFEEPAEFLVEIITGLDRDCFAAVALIFINNGRMPSPISLSDQERKALEALGSSEGNVREAFRALEGSLLLQLRECDHFFWTFRHPTIRDAFASIVAGNRELMGIYLAGVPPAKMIEEIVCGDIEIQGAKVLVPPMLYQIVVEKIDALDNKDRLRYFLARRVDASFLSFYLSGHRGMYEQLHKWIHFISCSSEIALLARLHEFGMLPEVERKTFVARAIEDLEDSLDAGFLSNPSIRNMFLPGDIEDALAVAREFIVNGIDDEIKSTKDSYPPHNKSVGDPEAWFGELKDSLRSLASEFTDEPDTMEAINDSFEKINGAISSLEEDLGGAPDDDDYEYPNKGLVVPGSGAGIFEDVDE